MGRHVPGTFWLATSLAATMVAATFFQFSLGAFAPQISRDIALSIADIGLVVGVLFAVSVPVSLVAGRWVDRVGARWGLAVILTAAGLATVLTATAGTRTDLLIAVVPASVAMAGCTPVTNRLSREAVDPTTRNLLVSVAQTGVQLGAVATGLLALLGPGVGWRALIASLLGVILIAVVSGLLARRGRERGETDGPLPAPRAPTEPVAATPRRPPTPRGHDTFPVRPLTIFAIVMALPGGITITYLATFAVETARFSAAVAGSTAIAYGAVALLTRASLSRLVPPHRNVTSALAVTTLGGAVAMVLFIAAPEVPAMIWFGAALFGMTGLTWPAILMIAVVRHVAPTRTASATGTVLSAFYLGLLLGPLGAATLLDRGTAFVTIWSIAALLYLTALIPLHVARQGAAAT